MALPPPNIRENRKVSDMGLSHEIDSLVFYNLADERLRGRELADLAIRGVKIIYSMWESLKSDIYERFGEFFWTVTSVKKR